MRIQTVDASLARIVRPPDAIVTVPGGSAPLDLLSEGYSARSFYCAWENLQTDVSYPIVAMMDTAGATTPRLAFRGRQAAATQPPRVDIRVDYADGPQNSVITPPGSTARPTGALGLHYASVRLNDGFSIIRTNVDDAGFGQQSSPSFPGEGLTTDQISLGSVLTYHRPMIAMAWRDFHDDATSRRIIDWMRRRYSVQSIMTWGTASAATLKDQDRGFVTVNSGASLVANEEFYHPGGPTLVIRTYVKGTPLPVGAGDAGRGRIRYSLIRSSDGAEVYASGQTFDPDVWTYVNMTFGTHNILPGKYRLRISGASNFQSPVLELALARKTSA